MIDSHLHHGHSHPGHPHQAHAHAHDGPPTSVDPVCGMSVDPDKTAHNAEHAGHTHHFCSAGCRTRFQADPAKYLAPKAPTPPAAPDAIYTCPMHPEVQQGGPGSCPLCGMALEPATFTADSGPNPELADMTRRFWAALVLAVPVFVLEMGGHLGGAMSMLVPRSTSN